MVVVLFAATLSILLCLVAGGIAASVLVDKIGGQSMRKLRLTEVKGVKLGNASIRVPTRPPRLPLFDQPAISSR